MRLIRAYKWTLGTTLVLVILLTWLVAATALSWGKVLLIMLPGAMALGKGLWQGAKRPRTDLPHWVPKGPSLPCPPGCRLTVEHRHDPRSSWQ